MADDQTVPAARLTTKGRATRARIVAAAAALVSERGVAGTSIEGVRRAAGVSGSQLTHYFPDKRALIRSVVAWQADAVADLHRDPALGRFDSLDDLQRWADLIVAGQRQRGCRGGCGFGSLVSPLAETDADARADLAAGFERWTGVLRAGLAAMRDRGGLRPDADPDELALGLLAALQGGLLMTQAQRDTRPLEAALNGMLAHVRSLAS